MGNVCTKYGARKGRTRQEGLDRKKKTGRARHEG
jgi:hypothetical protein